MTAPQSRPGSPSSWTPGACSRRSARSGCTWPPRARPPGRSGPIPRRCSGSPPPCLRREPAAPAGRTVSKQDVQEWIAWLLGRYSAAYASNQFRALQQFFKWLAAEERDPGPDGRAEAAARPGQARAGLRRRGPAAAGACLRGPVVPAAPRRRDDRRVHGDRDPAVGDWRASGMTRTTRGAATSTCGSGRSPSTARAARPGPSRSATMPRAAWTGTCASAPGTPRHTGRSCGSGSTTAAR